MSMLANWLNRLENLLKKSSKIKSNESSLVILSFKFIGDTVFTIPAIQKIIEFNPNREVIICCYTINRDIYKNYFDSVKYLIFRPEDLLLSKRIINKKFLSISLYLRQLHAETTFDFTSCWKSAIMSIIIGSTQKIGFGNTLLSGFYDYFIPTSEKSQTEMFLEPVRLFYNKPIINFQWVEKNSKISNISILIIPFAGWAAKEWGINKYLKLTEFLSRNYDTKILYEFGKMDKQIEKNLKLSCFTVVQSRTIDELIKAISGNSLIISNDTGPLYISYLMGKYSFGIFGPTNPDFHLLDSRKQQYIQSDLLCSPKSGEKLCFTFGGRKGCPSNECMNSLSLEIVIERIVAFITQIKLENKIA